MADLASSYSQGMNQGMNILKAQEVGRERQGRNLLTQLAQQNVPTEKQVNILAQAGFNDLANLQLKKAQAERQQRAKMEEDLISGISSPSTYNYAMSNLQQIVEPQRFAAVQKAMGGGYQPGYSEFMAKRLLGKDVKPDIRDIDISDVEQQKRAFYRGYDISDQIGFKSAVVPRWKMQVTASPEEANEYLSKGGFNKLEQQSIGQEQGIYKLVNKVDKLIDYAQSDDAVLGTTGDVLGFANSMVSQFEQVTGMGAEGGVIKDTDLDSNKYSDWRKKAMEGDRKASLVIDLAYQLAKLRDPGGKVSDKDFLSAERVIETGGSRGSMITVLQSLRENYIADYDMEERVLEKRGAKNKGDYFDKDLYTKNYRKKTEETKTDIEKRLESSGIL